MQRLVVGALIAAPFAVGVAMAATAPAGETVFTFADREINESSGLVALDDFAVTVNDSGDAARVFVVSPETGETLGVVSYDGPAVDVEALAPAAGGEAAVWVGDIGDNLRRRDDLAVTKVPVSATTTTVPGERYEVAWEGGADDAEALLVHPVSGQMYAVTKAVVGGEILRAPAELSATQPNVFTPVAEAPALVTDGAFFPDGAHFVLRNYGRVFIFETATMRQVGDVDLPSQQQGEGIAVTPDGEMWISTEGINTDVVRVELPPDLAAVVAGTVEEPDSPEAGTSDDPAGDLPGVEDTTAGADDPAVMPWVIGGLAGLVLVVVLVRSLRPR
ncbi:hypothetical protein [Nocardioides sp. AE5]|uniref:hypothetical protein n=1 Tax=Nocardioides sp. AE5 TaxID=2962573 RepID=UPI0028824BB6|nr:hypothetical protein [Nocardioides sp. AE5]MDT0200771.1 hypothetical protein [Nocardioides sp. AE5]